MTQSQIPPVLPVPEEEIVDLVTSLPASPTCTTDAGHAIEEKLPVEPYAGRPIIEALLQQKSLEARTATPVDEIAPDKRDVLKGPSSQPYKLARPDE